MRKQTPYKLPYSITPSPFQQLPHQLHLLPLCQMHSCGDSSSEANIKSYQLTNNI